MHEWDRVMSGWASWAGTIGTRVARAPVALLALTVALAGDAAAQGAKLPGIPVVLDEMLAEMKDPPMKHDAREQALVALFKQAGATDGEIDVLPLSDSVKPRLQAARDGAIARLKQAGASETEIE